MAAGSRWYSAHDDFAAPSHGDVSLRSSESRDNFVMDAVSAGSMTREREQKYQRGEGFLHGGSPGGRAGARRSLYFIDRGEINGVFSYRYYPAELLGVPLPYGCEPCGSDGRVTLHEAGTEKNVRSQENFFRFLMLKSGLSPTNCPVRLAAGFTVIYWPPSRCRSPRLSVKFPIHTQIGFQWDLCGFWVRDRRTHQT